MTQQSQQQILEEQKQNCPMCKIVSGEIPAQKVYENGNVVAIMDINPASKGHVLVLPKEHYPILPIVPSNIFRELFVAIREISKCVEDGVISQGITTLIASGGAAGQQLPHMIIHLIPRESGDGLEKFELKNIKFDEKKQKEQGEAKSLLEKNLKISLGRRFGNIKVTKEEVINLVNKNPQLKQIILSQPEEFKKLVPQNEQLKAIFGNVNIDEIIEIVKGKKENTKEEDKNQKNDDDEQENDVTAEDKIVEGEFEDVDEEKIKDDKEKQNEDNKSSVDDLLDALGGGK